MQTFAPTVWITLVTLALLGFLGSAFVPYFPGDVAVTRFLQAVTLGTTEWARLVTSTAKPPTSFILLILSTGISWRLLDWRAAALALISFFALWGVADWLKPLAGRPRPDPDLVRVVGSPLGFSFPSTFAMIYAATVGYLATLIYFRYAGPLRRTILSMCAVLLVIGGSARVVLGAHWPSDIVLSYLIGFLFVALLVRFASKRSNSLSL
jgi:undecaprenyl-diphosphatase